MCARQDDGHLFEAGKLALVCGNSAAMLGAAPPSLRQRLRLDGSGLSFERGLCVKLRGSGAGGCWRVARASQLTCGA
eukprot:1533335-Rhodomonas_salina.4